MFGREIPITPSILTLKSVAQMSVPILIVSSGLTQIDLVRSLMFAMKERLEKAHLCSIMMA